MNNSIHNKPHNLDKPIKKGSISRGREENNMVNKRKNQSKLKEQKKSTYIREANEARL